MKNFATLISALESSNKTNDKIEAIVDYLRTASDSDKLWLLALFTGKKPKRPINTNLIRRWALEITDIPEWLFLECYSNVGDLGETLSLILPKSSHQINKTLSEWMLLLQNLTNKTEEEKKEFVLQAWYGLDTTERFIFNKLVGGSFRVGVSYKLLVNAIAKFENKEPSEIMHRVMGGWQFNQTTYDELINGEAHSATLSSPYPFCLAHALDKPLEELGQAADWQIEYKWDGIRGQIIKRKDEIYIWSRGEELVTHQFPEMVATVKNMNGDFVLDGEILVYKENTVMNFNHLQSRLNRKTISKKLLTDAPIAFFAYDLLEYNGDDMRNKELHYRRNLLEEILMQNATENIFISTIISIDNWEGLGKKRDAARLLNSEGLMLKNKNSLYHSGRKRGNWWKWKVNPLSIDAVLIYAQKGSGRRSNFYTDYTFAVRNDEGLVTIAKAYSGLTDKEITEVDRFVKNNSIEKFGPVRTVKPELVFEVGFEGIAFSNRHKSGVALRFPRILRWRKDKNVSEIDHIDEIKKMIKN